MVFIYFPSKIMYLNRSDNQVQINGYRVELGEVEYKVKEFLKLENCIAFVNENNKQLVAVLEDKKELDKDLKKELLKRLPFYMQPKKFYFMDQFPLNSNSKIDRKSIKEKFNEN